MFSQIASRAKQAAQQKQTPNQPACQPLNHPATQPPSHPRNRLTKPTEKKRRVKRNIFIDIAVAGLSVAETRVTHTLDFS